MHYYASDLHHPGRPRFLDFDLVLNFYSEHCCCIGNIHHWHSDSSTYHRQPPGHQHHHVGHWMVIYTRHWPISLIPSMLCHLQRLWPDSTVGLFDIDLLFIHNMHCLPLPISTDPIHPLNFATAAYCAWHYNLFAWRQHCSQARCCCHRASLATSPGDAGPS